MTTDPSWLLIVALAAAYLFYRAILVRRERAHAESRSSEIVVASNHLSDLVGRGTRIILVAGELPNVALAKNEELLCVLPRTTLVEPRAVRTWHGRSSGQSIRIAKGFSVRMGASRGTSESHEELRPIDAGTLVLTTERLFFLGLKRTTSTRLEKIIDIDNEGYSNWLRVNREGKQKAECYQFDQSLRVDYEYNGQTFSTPLHSEMIQGAIDQAVLFRRNPELAVPPAQDQLRLPPT
jgi:hypothetical protein